MSLKFRGNYAKLQKCVSGAGFSGQWRELNGNHHQYRTKGGAVLNWWASSATIQFQGRDPMMEFQRAFIKIASRKGRLAVEGRMTSNSLEEENAELRKMLAALLLTNSKLERPPSQRP